MGIVEIILLIVRGLTLLPSVVTLIKEIIHFIDELKKRNVAVDGKAIVQSVKVGLQELRNTGRTDKLKQLHDELSQKCDTNNCKAPWN